MDTHVSVPVDLMVLTVRSISMTAGKIFVGMEPHAL